MIYLDNQATTACDPRVLEAMLPLFAVQYGNAHSVEHAMGRDADGEVERARAAVAALLRADPREIVFTSGATEANNLAIKGAARHARSAGDTRRRVITLATEHPCVLASVQDLAAEGFEPVVLPVEPDGRLDPERLRAALRVPTLLVSVMAVNNETGVIQDIAACADLVHAAGALFHSDLAQAAGKIELDIPAIGLDLASVSAHKFYGPKGVGALYVRRRPRVRLAPLFSGGGQERTLRSGTLPVPLVAGFGVACRLAADEQAEERIRLRALRDRLLERLLRAIPGLVVNGSLTHRVPGNLNLRFPHCAAAEIIERAPGLCLSTGSACSSAAVEPSSVLRAMGLSRDEAARSLRLAIGRFTSPAELDHVTDILKRAHDLPSTDHPSETAECLR